MFNMASLLKMSRHGHKGAGRVLKLNDKQILNIFWMWIWYNTDKF